MSLKLKLNTKMDEERLLVLDLRKVQRTPARPLNLRKPPKTPRCRAPLPRMKDQHQKIHCESDKLSRSSREQLDKEESEHSDYDDSDEDNEDNELINDIIRDESINSHGTTQTSRTLRSRNGINLTSRNPLAQKIPLPDKKSISASPKKEKLIKQKENGNLYSIILIGIPLILCGIVIYFSLLNYSNVKTYSSASIEQPNELMTEEKLIENLEKNIQDLMRKFKKQDRHIWSEITAGIAEVVKNPVKPSILLFFSNRTNPMSCLAKMVGKASRVALGSDSSLNITPEQMGDDYGAVIENFRDQIREQKVVIIENLLEIHPEAMRALHNLCDRESPLVNKAVYILTMVAPGYKNNDKPMDFIEAQLTQKLKNTINAEKLQPLITRITDGAIILVQPEPDEVNCPVRY